MNLGKMLSAVAAVVAISGCTTMGTNEAIVPLQSATAQMIGLASSDELSVTNVKAGDPDALGAQDLTYTATTKNGRRFDCKARMMPGLLISKPTLTTPSCAPIQVHSTTRKSK